MYAEQHPRQKLSDYVLGLLAVDDQRAVERHLVACAHCRAAVREERRMAAALRATLQAATRPEAGQLARLAPAVPATGTHRWRAERLRPLLALALCLVLLGGLYYFDNQHRAAGWTLPQTTNLAVTVTHTPTATVPPAEATAPAVDAVDAREAPLPPALAPAPTPVAALLTPTRGVDKN